MRSRGFSFLELLIAMAIFSLAAAVCVPLFTAVSSSMELGREAALLASELRYMRELSMGHPVARADFITVRAETMPTFYISQDRNEYAIIENQTLRERHKMPNGMRLAGDAGRIAFAPNGDANPLSLQLMYRGKGKYVIIDIVGRIRVSDVPPEG